jgi:hypothetical protein
LNALVALFFGVLLAVPAAANATASPPVALGAWEAGAPEWMSLLDDHAARVERSPAMLMWYQDWLGPLADVSKLEQVASRGAVPMITWEPWDHSAGTQQPRYSLKKIARGDFDSYIGSSANTVAAWGKPLFLRLGHEMNGDWYPWGHDVNGNSPADFVAAWRHVVGIFRERGASNVRWVWSPNVDYGGATFTEYFPGDAWVDWAALDGYNWGTLHGARGWQSFGAIFGPSYDVLAKLTRRPLMIAETASGESGGSKAAWIQSAFLTELPRRLPRIRAVVWFDQNKEADWRIVSSPASLDAYRQVAASPQFAAGAAELVGAPRVDAAAASRRAVITRFRRGAAHDGGGRRPRTAGYRSRKGPRH